MVGFPGWILIVRSSTLPKQVFWHWWANCERKITCGQSRMPDIFQPRARYKSLANFPPLGWINVSIDERQPLPTLAHPLSRNLFPSEVNTNKGNSCLTSWTLSNNTRVTGEELRWEQEVRWRLAGYTTLSWARRLENGRRTEHLRLENLRESSVLQRGPVSPAILSYTGDEPVIQPSTNYGVSKLV